MRKVTVVPESWTDCIGVKTAVEGKHAFVIAVIDLFSRLVMGYKSKGQLHVANENQCGRSESIWSCGVELRRGRTSSIQFLKLTLSP